MIRIGIYEESLTDMPYLKRALEFYADSSNTKIEVTWFTDSEACEKVRKYADIFDLILVSFKAGRFREFCKAVLDIKDECRICCYDIDPSGRLHVSYPMYHFIDDKEKALKYSVDISSEIGDILRFFQSAGNLVLINTRQMLYIIPAEEIMYMYSDLKYVNIVTADCNEISVYKKLDDIEKSTYAGFIRIHKSYYVNTIHIRAVEKKSSSGCVIMDNDAQLPISTSRYREVLNILSADKY